MFHDLKIIGLLDLVICEVIGFLDFFIANNIANILAITERNTNTSNLYCNCT